MIVNSLIRYRILVVDDDPQITLLLSEALRQRYEVLSALSGAEALEILGRESVAAVVVDFMMPGMNGVEVLSQVHKLHPAVARIMMTASDRMTVVEEAMNVAKPHRFFSKPLRLGELAGFIVEAIREANLEVENAKLVEELRAKNQALNEAVSELRLYGERLESEVQARTVELRSAVAELEKLALRDGLTGLYNHRYFQEALDIEISRSRRVGHKFGLIFLDIDHFKNYNDTLGHPAGDRLLKQLSAVMCGGGVSGFPATGRRADLAARYGGEEFVMILPQTDKQGSVIKAERIRRAIYEFPFDGNEVQPGGHMSISVGVACYPEDGADKTTLLETVDRALYEAKRRGRNQVCEARMDPAGSP